MLHRFLYSLLLLLVLRSRSHPRRVVRSRRWRPEWRAVAAHQLEQSSPAGRTAVRDLTVRAADEALALDHSRGQARGERRGEPVAEKPVAVCPSTGTPETFRHHHNPHLFPAQPTRRHLGNPRNLLRFISLSCGTKRHGVEVEKFWDEFPLHRGRGRGGYNRPRERKTKSSHTDNHEI